MLLTIFFFQAEDGIRDIGVTGVQTCALPIYRVAADRTLDRVKALLEHSGDRASLAELYNNRGAVAEEHGNYAEARSEERRVGKECRSRRWAEEEEKKRM